jgi:hypothetical protein
MAFVAVPLDYTSNQKTSLSCSLGRVDLILPANGVKGHVVAVLQLIGPSVEAPIWRFRMVSYLPQLEWSIMEYPKIKWMITYDNWGYPMT